MKLGAVYVQVQLQDLDGSERDRWSLISFLPPAPTLPPSAADGFRNQDSFRSVPFGSQKATVPGRDKIKC